MRDAGLPRAEPVGADGAGARRRRPADGGFDARRRWSAVAAMFLGLVPATGVLYSMWLTSAAADCSDCSAYQLSTAVLAWYAVPLAWVGWIAFVGVSGWQHFRR